MAQASTKVGLLDHIGGGNLGDEATLEAVASNIRRRWPNAKIVAFSMNPDDTVTRHGVMSYPIRRKCWCLGYAPAVPETTLKVRVKAVTRKCKGVFYLLKVASAVARLPGEVFRELLFLMSSWPNIGGLDLFIISGGGQLTDKGGPWGFPYTIFKWVVLARLAGVRCIFLNLGAGPLNHRLSKLFVTRALLGADYVSLRDEKSRVLVNKIGFTGESRVYPDGVYGLDITGSNGSPTERRAQPLVGFAPMPYPGSRGDLIGKEQIVYDEFIRKLAMFASWLVRQSYTLSMFGTDIGVDPRAIEDLQAALLSHHGITAPQSGVSQPIKSVSDLLAEMSRMDYVVTCRFHGVVFAHLLNKPVLAIAHHRKVRDLMDDLELSSCCVDIRNFDLELLTEKFAWIVRNREEIKSCMAASLSRNRRRLRSQFGELFR